VVKRLRECQQKKNPVLPAAVAVLVVSSMKGRSAGQEKSHSYSMWQH
jgi:hypothetical protein